jgi:anti-sigma factor RsiW
MDCADLRTLLHAYLDGEASPDERATCEEHLLVCAGCRDDLESLRALSAGLGDAALRHRPPADLAARLETALRTADEPPRRLRLSAATWAAAAALLLGVGLTAWAVVRIRTMPGDEERLAREVTSAHARSLQDKHLLDRPSSDRHEVKPWFQGRLDFSPPVKDLSEQGFKLEGGRLDYLDERPVAALVYRRREHVINLFVWPGPPGDSAVRSTTRRGYRLAYWRQEGLNFWAVSDLNADELTEFARLFR